MAAPSDNHVAWGTVMDGKLYPACNPLEINVANKHVASHAITIEQVREGVRKMKELTDCRVLQKHQYIITHPDNVGDIRRRISREARGVEAPKHSDTYNKYIVDQFLMGSGCSILSQWWMERYTDDVVLPGGQVVPRGEIKITERFCEYGPEDYDYLKYCGMVKGANLPLIYVAEEDADALMRWPTPVTF
jgi:hypothetical protein